MFILFIFLMQTPLHLAVNQNEVGIVNMFSQHGVNTNILDTNGMSELWLCCATEIDEYTIY